jgi:hypothetical protein
MEIERMQIYINQIERDFGRTSSAVRVMQTVDQRYAYASGLNILGISLIGSINVDMERLSPHVFTDSEIQFILDLDTIFFRSLNVIPVADPITTNLSNNPGQS